MNNLCDSRGLVGRVGVWLRRWGMVEVGMAKVKWGGEWWKDFLRGGGKRGLL